MSSFRAFSWYIFTQNKSRYRLDLVKRLYCIHLVDDNYPATDSEPSVFDIVKGNWLNIRLLIICIQYVCTKRASDPIVFGVMFGICDRYINDPR